MTNPSLVINGRDRSRNSITVTLSVVCLSTAGDVESAPEPFRPGKIGSRSASFDARGCLAAVFIKVYKPL